MTVLELDDIHTYYGNSHVLHGVSLDLAECEVVALLGRNGAGKTTMRSIIDVTPPRRGSVVYRGEDIVDLSPDEINGRGINLVPEDRRVFPTLSVQENLVLAHKLAVDPKPVEEMYDLFPILDELRSSKAQNLSGASSRCSRSHARSSSGHRCCCSTNRPRDSLRSSSTTYGRCSRKSSAET